MLKSDPRDHAEDASVRLARQQLEPYLPFRRAELFRLLVPGSSDRDVSGYSTYAEFLQHLRIVGGTKRQRGLRIMSLDRAPQQHACASQVATGSQFLAPLDESGNCGGVKPRGDVDIRFVGFNSTGLGSDAFCRPRCCHGPYCGSGSVRARRLSARRPCPLHMNELKICSSVVGKAKFNGKIHGADETSRRMENRIVKIRSGEMPAVSSQWTTRR